METDFCETEEPKSLAVADSIREQLLELDMLNSMYNADELVFDADCNLFVARFLEDSEDQEKALDEVSASLCAEGTRIGFSLKLLILGNPVEVKCDLPTCYPHAGLPSVFVRTDGFTSRRHQSQFRSEFDGFLSSLPSEEPVLFTILDYITTTLPQFFSRVSTDKQAADAGESEGDCSFTRFWIYSHHIYSKFKRRDIISWASELNLTGFSMCGKPGIVCVEGYTDDVEEYWARLRRLNWKRLFMKEREDIKCSSQAQKLALHRFGAFEEKVFTSRPGKGCSQSFHSDIGELGKFLQEHSCGHMFEMYFGVEAKIDS